jgi:outer membrane protein assembly factor BamB
MGMRRPAAILAVAALCLIGGEPRPGAPPRERPPRDGIVVLRPADALGALVAGAGDLWVDDRARERLLRIDPGSGSIRAALPVDGRVALAAGDGAVWALQSGGGYGIGLRGPLLRVDPATDRVRARIPLVTASGGSVLGFGLEPAGRDVWVWGPRDILRIDGRAARVTARIAVRGDHGELTGLAAAGGQLVAGVADGHLLRFDARTGRRTGASRVALRRPSPRALGHGRLLLTASGVVAVFDLRARRVAWKRRLGFRAGAVLGRDGLVWVHSAAVDEPGDRVTALRLATGRVVTSRIVPGFGSTGIAAGAGQVSIATAGGRLLLLRPFPE